MASVDPRERIIALLDLDAFYAQVEMKRLNSAPSIPLAVRQWDGLIAVNYAARAAGVTRHMRADEALTRCPSIKLVHVELIDADGVVPDDAMARHSQRTAKALPLTFEGSAAEGDSGGAASRHGGWSDTKGPDHSRSI